MVMMNALLAAAVLAQAAFAIPAPAPEPTVLAVRDAAPQPAPTAAPAIEKRTTTLSGNPFSGVQLYANPYYSSEIYTSAIPSLTGSLATAATAVAEVGTFVWL